jgi:ketosteroid isomerase-like protein
MSEENVEIVRRSFAAYARGDIEETLTYIDPEGVLQSAIIGGAEGNVYRGHDGFRTWHAETEAAFEELTTELMEFRDLGDRVLGLGHVHARGRESGLELDSETGWIFTLRDGKVVKAEGFLSIDKALAAAGASE